MAFGTENTPTFYEQNQGQAIQVLGKMKNDATGIINKVEDHELYLKPHLTTHPSGFGYVEQDTEHPIPLENIFGSRLLTKTDYQRLLEEHPVLQHIGSYVSISNGQLGRTGKLVDIVSGYAQLSPSLIRTPGGTYESEELVTFPMANTEIVGFSEAMYNNIKHDQNT